MVSVINNLITGHSIPKQSKVVVLQHRKSLIQVEYKKEKIWIDKKEVLSTEESESGTYFINISGKVSAENLQEVLADIADLIESSIHNKKTEKPIQNAVLIATVKKIFV